MVNLVRMVDRVSAAAGWIAKWLMLAACLISAGNAASRYVLGLSSNAWLEIQWYFFAAMVLLGAPLVLRVNEHVRVDILYGRLRPRTRALIDLAGLLLFLLPASVLLAKLSWPFFAESWRVGETSTNAGGLDRWPVKLLLPLGFALLSLQGVAEVAKRILYLRGVYNMDTHYERPLQ